MKSYRKWDKEDSDNDKERYNEINKEIQDDCRKA